MQNAQAIVADNEIVFRIVRPGAKHQGLPPELEVTPANFVRRVFAQERKESGLSVSRDLLSDRANVLHSFLQGRSADGYRFAESTAEQIRASGFDVLPSPSASNQGHASLRCATCNLTTFDCALLGGGECELDDLERRSQLADFFHLA